MKIQQILHKLYPHADHIPIFPEGIRGIWNFLGKNVKYPYAARMDGVSGKVLVGFTVEEDGSLTNFKIVKGVREDLDQAAIKALSQSPKWIPATYKGVPVKVESQSAYHLALSD